MSSDGIIKVSDFGLTEDVYTTEYFKQRKDSDEPIKLPLKWMALESIHYGKFSEKTDIVSVHFLHSTIFLCILNPSWHIVVVWCTMLGSVYFRKVSIPWNGSQRGSTHA